MEKQTKAKNKFLKLIPKAASPVYFQNLAFSPGKDKRSEVNASNKSKTHMGKGFSGPMISIIPAEARRKSSSNSSLVPQEPTSPKISCMGQIKHKKKLQKNSSSNNNNHKKSNTKAYSTIKPVLSPFEVVDTQKKKPSIKTLFGSSKPAGRKSDASADMMVSSLPDRAAPSLSQMKQFASSRETFANFDWEKVQVAPENSDLSDGEDEVIIPFSAPILVRGGGCQGIGGRIGVGGATATVALEPRKDINIWKRRTMAQPANLQVNNFVRSSR